VSAVRLGDAKTADLALAELERRAAAAGTHGADVPVMAKELAGVRALARDRGDEAVALLEQATALERALPPPLGPPRPVKPAGELYGEVLLELHRPREAGAAFEKALDRWPNRSLSLLGRARAAAAASDPATARRYYKLLLANWQGADETLPELREARAF
jgi:tetratricopeptide (TPR) repeat protein